MKTSRAHLWLSPEVRGLLLRHGDNLSEAMRRIVLRYDALLERARRSMAERFTAEELANIAQLTAGTAFEAHNLEGILGNAEDAFPDEVPHPEALESLREKLQQLTLLEHAALVDAAERFWRLISLGAQIRPEDLLK